MQKADNTKSPLGWQIALLKIQIYTFWQINSLSYREILMPNIAAVNLEKFIDCCKNNLSIFGMDLDFDSHVWDMTDTVIRNGMRRNLVYFSTLESAINRQPSWMHESFLPFAKSYFIYMYGLCPSKSYGHRIHALRTMEAALVELNPSPDPTKIDATVLNRAAQIAVDHYSPSAAYYIGRCLEELSIFMSENMLLVVPIVWRNPVKKPLVNFWGTSAGEQIVHQ
ncbi:hypothetical protein LJC36_01290 [Desulfovibrio sp. OttesenSCG-928-C14]|nr:hypothetical protein [Desulfovibrio sp. OttesenSCG-928-C14]